MPDSTPPTEHRAENGEHPSAAPATDASPQDMEALTRRCHELEEELKTIQAIQLTAVEQAPVGLLVADARERRIRLASLKGLGILGKTDASCRNAPLHSWSLLHPDGTPFQPEDRPLERAMCNGEVVEGVEALIAGADGERRHVTINAAPVRDESGEIVAGVSIFLDVTERRRLECQRTQTLTFFAHDMKSPLMGALGLTRRLLDGKEGPLSGRQLENLDMVASLLDRVLTLSMDFLDVARMDQAGFTLAREPVPLAPMLQALAREFRERAEDKGLVFHAELPPELPAILGDRQRLMRMVANLLDNAVKYTSAGVVALVARRNGRELEIHVLDDGPGLSDHDQHNIFEQFFRGEAGKGSEGSGVGLAAVRAIAQAHGGRVAGENRPDGHGAMFSIWLPLAE
ncbi:sensor histidine kinase [Megalodesulfovibrio paquesii]